MGKREKEKTWEAQVMQSTSAHHHSLTDAQPVPQQQMAPPSQLPPSLNTGHDVISLCPVQVRVLALIPSGLSTFSLAEHQTLKSLWVRVSTAEQQLKHYCVIDIILILVKKTSSVSATRKKINSQLKPEKYQLLTPYHLCHARSHTSQYTCLFIDAHTDTISLICRQSL